MQRLIFWPAGYYELANQYKAVNKFNSNWRICVGLMKHQTSTKLVREKNKEDRSMYMYVFLKIWI